MAMAAEAAEAADAGKTIILISADGKRFEVTEAVASQSQLVSNMIEDDCTGNGVPLPNVAGDVLAKVVDYCNMHAGAIVTSDAAGSSSDNPAKGSRAEELKKFEAEFVNLDIPMLTKVIMAANFMSIKSLLDVTCQRVADMMTGKTPEQMREMFSIENDFTPEEAEAIRQENAWAFDY